MQDTKTAPRRRREWYRKPDAAAYLGSTERQVSRWVAQRRIGHTKLGNEVLFSKEQLDAFIEANTVHAVRREAVAS